jgi:hypothetical protein
MGNPWQRRTWPSPAGSPHGLVPAVIRRAVRRRGQPDDLCTPLRYATCPLSFGSVRPSDGAESADWVDACPLRRPWATGQSSDSRPGAGLTPTLGPAPALGFLTVRRYRYDE